MAGTDSKRRADDATMPPRRRSRWWIAVLTFVAGVVVGVLIVGFLTRNRRISRPFRALRRRPHRPPEARVCPPRPVLKSMRPA